MSKEDLRELLKKIELLNQEKTDEGELKYNYFRNKMYAHIDLNDDGTLKKINQLSISQGDFTTLFTLSEKAYDKLFLYLDCASSDHMEGYMNTLKESIWNSFENAGLIEKKTR